MLKGVPAILSPELLKVLCEMGHGDRGWHSAYDARAGGAYLVYDGPDNPFDRWFLSVETARSLGQKLDLIRNAELAGIIVWEASLDTKNHSFAAQLRDTLLK